MQEEEVKWIGRPAGISGSLADDRRYQDKVTISESWKKELEILGVAVLKLHCHMKCGHISMETESVLVLESHATFLDQMPLYHTHTYTHPFNGPLSGTTQVNQYQKGKTNLDFTEARDRASAGPYTSLHLTPDR